MNIRAALLIVVGLIQLAVPGWMIFEQEQTLRLGTEYKFQTEPVDPYDLFRGRYVALRFKAEHVELKGNEGENASAGHKVFVAVKKNAAGFAEVERVSSKPLSGDNVFTAIDRSGWRSKTLRLEFPFNRYFMEETLAPQAEAAYRKANISNSNQQTWAVVRLRNGKAALADVVIDGQPIRDYLRDHPQPKKESVKPRHR
jgi:uncharacterized membrane-anchored protein